MGSITATMTEETAEFLGHLFYKARGAMGFLALPEFKLYSKYSKIITVLVLILISFFYLCIFSQDFIID